LRLRKIPAFSTFPFSREVVVTVEYPAAENPFLGGYRNKVHEYLKKLGCYKGYIVL
jgi:hypothetical protein